MHSGLRKRQAGNLVAPIPTRSQCSGAWFAADDRRRMHCWCLRTVHLQRMQERPYSNFVARLCRHSYYNLNARRNHLLEFYAQNTGSEAGGGRPLAKRTALNTP
jgi:hypothetical protein